MFHFLQRMLRGWGKCWSREGKSISHRMPGCVGKILQSLKLLTLSQRVSKASLWKSGLKGEIKTFKVLSNTEILERIKERAKHGDWKKLCFFAGYVNHLREKKRWKRYNAEALKSSYYKCSWLILTLLGKKITTIDLMLATPSIKY